MIIEIPTIANIGPHRVRISRALLQISRSDFEWAMDHSRRKYRVRIAIDSDHPSLAAEADYRADAIKRGWKPVDEITIIRLCDGKKWVCGSHTISFPYRWKDTDDYAERRIVAIEEAARKLMLGEL